MKLSLYALVSELRFQVRFQGVSVSRSCHGLYLACKQMKNKLVSQRIGHRYVLILGTAFLPALVNCLNIHDAGRPNNVSYTE